MAKKDLEAARAFIRQQSVSDVRKTVRGVANRWPQLTRVERTTLAESRAVMGDTAHRQEHTPVVDFPFDEQPSRV